MKIGILTFHCADNYGAVLQAFALYKKIIELYKAEVYIINYRPKSIVAMSSLFNFIGCKNKTEILRRLLSIIISLPFWLIRKHNFSSFRKSNFNFIDVEKANILDVIICGSDQIWNQNITNGIDAYYFGNFKNFNGKVIAYAASDGGNHDFLAADNICLYLYNFSAISVREKTMLPFIQKYYKAVKIAIDPVLLMDKHFWGNIAGKSGYKYSDYILIYKLGKNFQIDADALSLANKIDKKIIEINYSLPVKKIFNKRYTLLRPNVYDFIALISNADYILTNSFHGTAFSIIFNRKFYSYNIKDERSQRITNLLSELNLMERYIEKTGSIELGNIDYQLINVLIEKKRKDSIGFLNYAGR